jgi:hypothetical protein
MFYTPKLEHIFPALEVFLATAKFESFGNPLENAKQPTSHCTTVRCPRVCAKQHGGVFNKYQDLTMIGLRLGTVG